MFLVGQISLSNTILIILPKFLNQIKIKLHIKQRNSPSFCHQMRSNKIFALFLVVGLLASQALAHSYWIAYCKQLTNLLWSKKTIMHAFCESKNYMDCENNFTNFTTSRHRGESACYGKKRAFHDHRGVHKLVCKGATLVALQHENQEKDSCMPTTANYTDVIFRMKGNFSCSPKWKCGN